MRQVPHPVLVLWGILHELHHPLLASGAVTTLESNFASNEPAPLALVSSIILIHILGLDGEVVLETCSIEDEILSLFLLHQW